MAALKTRRFPGSLWLRGAEDFFKEAAAGVGLKKAVPRNIH